MFYLLPVEYPAVCNLVCILVGELPILSNVTCLSGASSFMSKYKPVHDYCLVAFLIRKTSTLNKTLLRSLCNVMLTWPNGRGSNQTVLLIITSAAYFPNLGFW